jgi:hypothetical protein
MAPNRRTDASQQVKIVIPIGKSRGLRAKYPDESVGEGKLAGMIRWKIIFRI